MIPFLKYVHTQRALVTPCTNARIYGEVMIWDIICPRILTFDNTTNFIHFSINIRNANLFFVSLSNTWHKKYILKSLLLLDYSIHRHTGVSTLVFSFVVVNSCFIFKGTSTKLLHITILSTLSWMDISIVCNSTCEGKGAGDASNRDQNAEQQFLLWKTTFTIWRRSIITYLQLENGKYYKNVTYLETSSCKT